jgi:hypothetical protein
MAEEETKVQLVTEKSKDIRDLDLTQPVFMALSGYAGRICKLLSASTVLANPDLEGSLDDFLGAVYALIFARQANFAERPDRSIDPSAVKFRAGQIAKGEVRVDGLWMAGFHFNSALFRTAAVYHRILKIVVGRPATREDMPPLQTEALGLYGQWVSIRLHKVYIQVNELKHDPQGIYEGRLVTYPEALAAIGDLLDLIEAWTAANIPSKPTP